MVRCLGKCRMGQNVQETGSLTLGDNAEVGNNVTVEGTCFVGADTRIGHNVVLSGNVHIGSGNWIYPNCVIGAEPQDALFHLEANADRMRGRRGEDCRQNGGRIRIGDSNIIREGTSVHMPTGDLTSVGNHNYIMNNNAVPHDCTIGDNVRIADNVSLGGHTQIHSNVFLGFGCSIHQHRRVGRHAVVGMGCNIARDVLPYSIMNQNRFTKINGIGLRRGGVPPEEIQDVASMYEGLARSGGITTAKKWYVEEAGAFIRGADKRASYYGPPSGKIPIKTE